MSGSLTYAGRRRALTMTWGQARMPAMLPTMAEEKMTFEERARAGGRGRTASMSADERSESARNAARASHSLVAYGRKAAAKWADATDDERREFRRILREAGVIR